MEFSEEYLNRMVDASIEKRLITHNCEKNKCPKCKLSEMKPTYQAVGTSHKFNRKIENVKSFMNNDTYYVSDTVKKEHIIWTCPDCGYQVAKEIG